MKPFGLFLREARLQRRLSLKDVYRETGISDSRLSRIENGANTTEPTPRTLMALSKLFGLGLIELYEKAGYLNDEALSSYEQVFHNVDLLSDDERDHIQGQVDFIVKGRK